MKEDILEQLVDDYLQFDGYFTRHNIKFAPHKSHSDYNSQADCVHSDIDVLGINPKRTGFERVVAVSCKSWQGGFDAKWIFERLNSGKTISGRDAWKSFREIMSPKWSEAFVNAVHKMTGTRKFTYVVAVTLLKGSAEIWESHKPFRVALAGNPLKILTLTEVLKKLETNKSTTPAGSDIGRLLQLMRAAKKGEAALTIAMSGDMAEK